MVELHDDYFRRLALRLDAHWGQSRVELPLDLELRSLLAPSVNEHRLPEDVLAQLSREEFRDALLAFAVRCASFAVRTSEAAWLLAGLRALVIENCGSDERESLMAFAVIVWSCRLLSVDVGRLLRTACSFERLAADRQHFPAPFS